MTIDMGNDEFILYIRKNHLTCKRANDEMGRAIWRWIKAHDVTATKIDQGGHPVPPERDVPQECYWADGKPREQGAAELPNKATQFRFSRDLLPSLYTHLDDIGGGE